MIVLDPDFPCYEITSVCEGANEFDFLYFEDDGEIEEPQIVECYEYSALRGTFTATRLNTAPNAWHAVRSDV